MIRLLPGVCALVRLEVAFVREAASALQARVWLLARVHTLVHPQVARRREAPAALHAVVQSLARVELLVRPQVPQLGEATAALDALVRTLFANSDDPGPNASVLGTMARPQHAQVMVSPEAKSLASLEARKQRLACESLLLRHSKISHVSETLIRPIAVVRLAARL